MNQTCPWSLHYSCFWILFRGTSFPFVCPTEPIISYVHEKEGSEVSNDLNLHVNTSTGFKIKPIVTSQACQHLKTLLWCLSGFRNKFVFPNHISEQFNIFKSQAHILWSSIPTLVAHESYLGSTAWASGILKSNYMIETSVFSFEIINFLCSSK